uniref:Uncharacterized protein n=1 Tax=Utricularia reniformis TaxID=192314 RepID=A0A1Y0B069_9LAMI|nr:hypothetical protein AEK19_MT0580 [Utricularia reniformis]ART30836.1 hypothetical protein AEK19_MT0580 [Utricularia reniformis]
MYLLLTRILLFSEVWKGKSGYYSIALDRFPLDFGF